MAKKKDNKPDTPAVDVQDQVDETTQNTEEAGEEQLNAELSELAVLQQNNAELKDKYLRLVAEFENYKRLSAMETNGEQFDAEMHEAVTEIPAPNDDMKGKVIDTIEKGFLLNDKIIRHAKVVVGK